MDYLLNFNSCFYCVFCVCYSNSVGFTFFKLVDNIFVPGFLCDTQCIGFCFVVFAVEPECYPFVFDPFTIDFESCFQGNFFIFAIPFLLVVTVFVFLLIVKVTFAPAPTAWPSAVTTLTEKYFPPP